MKLRMPATRRPKRDRGSTAVETALAFSFLLGPLLGGLAEFVNLKTEVMQLRSGPAPVIYVVANRPADYSNDDIESMLEDAVGGSVEIRIRDYCIRESALEIGDSILSGNSTSCTSKPDAMLYKRIDLIKPYTPLVTDMLNKTGVVTAQYTIRVK